MKKTIGIIAASLLLLPMAGTLLPSAEAGAKMPGTTATIRKQFPALVEITAWKKVLAPMGNALVKNASAETRIATGKARRVAWEQKGAGVIVGRTGLVVTNAHVVTGTTFIDVKLSSGKTVRGTLVKAFPDDDLAFISLGADTPPTAVSFADADRLAIGDEVFVVGNSTYLKRTIIRGRVSELVEDLSDDRRGTFALFKVRFDFKSYHGDSGSAVFDRAGRLIGILFGAEVSSARNAAAVPSNTVAAYLKELER